ncbi:hypothetical protein C0989_009470 [Termitomyces sp. Mn162]|nr:hypothetical protein C0989_009470 [Termitomyces sp. Mn162]
MDSTTASANSLIDDLPGGTPCVSGPGCQTEAIHSISDHIPSRASLQTWFICPALNDKIHLSPTHIMEVQKKVYGHSLVRTLAKEHVAIKAVLFGSKEYRILEYLQNQGVPASPDEFQNVIPVLDILSCDGLKLSTFTQNSAWSASLRLFQRLRRYLNSDQDIKIENILVNHFDRYHFDGRNAHRRSLCIQGKLTYALFDFSHSTMFPQSVRLDECRLPSYISFGTYPLQRPDDTHQGEIDFNPFAFDVGMLGIVFCNEFQHLTTLAPMLAPLFDMMTTRNVSRRFTAAEALAFFEEQVQPLSPGLEKVGYRSRGSPSYPPRYDTFDRWQDLDPDFVEKWAKFRDAPVPFHVRLLRRLCERSWGWHLVNRIRYIARFITQWTPLCKGKSETLIQG